MESYLSHHGSHGKQGVCGSVKVNGSNMWRQQHRKSPLSVHRSFVIQFRAGTDIEQGRLEGRIEHVASGQTLYFHSLNDLLRFIAQTLTHLQIQPP
jgi:hypothetical protein